MGIVKGDSQGKFNPNAPITRAEFAAIAARFDDKANTTAVDFSDIASHWAKNEISAAANNGWINGYTDGTFRPNNKITRAEAMTLVNRVLKRLPETAEDLHNDMIKWSDNSDTSAVVLPGRTGGYEQPLLPTSRKTSTRSGASCAKLVTGPNWKSKNPPTLRQCCLVKNKRA